MGSRVLEPGQSFGRYRVDERIGAGGMGEVYRARDTQLGRQVALKVIAIDDGDDEDDRNTAVSRLMREARAAAALSHPHVVQVFDVGEVDGDPFIAMELVVGVSLRALVGRQDIALEDKLAWLTAIARALAAAHRADLIHRDVKPDNVMVSDTGLVKVLDFGIARAAPDSAAQESLPTLTAEGVVIGTPAYMAPEQLLREDMDGRADQFAWGVLAFELLTGRIPWGEGDGLTIVSRILKDKREAIGDVVSELPTVWSQAIERALSPVPDDRFDSMEALLTAVGEESARVSSRRSSLMPSDDSAELRSTELAIVPAPATQSALTTVRAGVEQPAKRGLGLRWLGSAALGVLALGAAFYAVTQDDAATSSPAPVASTSITLPASVNGRSADPDAQRAYDEAVLAIRAGNAALVIENLMRAVDEDPNFAAAHALLGLAAITSTPEMARRPLQLANERRDRLSERDRVMVDALAPCALAEQAQLRACLPGLSRWADDFPNDALAQAFTGFAWSTYDNARAQKYFQRAVAVDERFPFAWMSLAQNRASANDFAAAEHALSRCLAVAPGNRACLSERFQIAADRGEEATCDDTARTLRALYPDNGTAEWRFANVLAARGSDERAVAAAVARHAELDDGSQRADMVALNRATTDLWFGHFDRAIASLRPLHERVTKSHDPRRFQATAALLEALLEISAREEAGELAQALYVALPAEPPMPRNEALGLSQDPLPVLLSVLHRAGRMSATEKDDAVAAWMDQVARGGDLTWPWVWAYGPAAVAHDRASAAATLTLLRERDTALPEYHFGAHIFPVARTLALAGEHEEARRLLGYAEHHCRPLERPFERVRASLLLGETLRALGDDEEACAAHARVLARWGHDERSVTAHAARAARSALACPD